MHVWGVSVAQVRGCGGTGWDWGFVGALWVCRGHVREGTDTHDPPQPRAHLPAGARPPLPSARAVPAGRRHRPARSGHRPGAGLWGRRRPCCVRGGPRSTAGPGPAPPEGGNMLQSPTGNPRTPPSPQGCSCCLGLV